MGFRGFLRLGWMGSGGLGEENGQFHLGIEDFRRGVDGEVTGAADGFPDGAAHFDGEVVVFELDGQGAGVTGH